MLGSGIALVIGLVLGTAPREAPPVTWVDLKKETAAESAPAKKSALFARFAKDDKPPLADRVRAIREAARVLPANDAKRVSLAIAEAQLQSVAQSPARRKTALLDAKQRARRAGLDEKVRAIDSVLAGDEAVARLNVILTRRSRSSSKARGPSTAEENDVVTKVERSLPAWLALPDERQHGAARISLGRRALLNDDPNGERMLGDTIDALGSSPDTALVRADGYRALAAHLDALPERQTEAVAATLSADRASSLAPRLKPTSFTAPYVRSVETAALCKKARAQSISCAKVETDRFGDRTFYDFSQERSAAFNAARANDALAEYESLLHDCLKRGVKENLTTQTHVELEWSVKPDGTVLPAFDLRPMRLRGTSVERCIGDAFKMFRYPRYRGEMQHVRLSFDVGE